MSNPTNLLNQNLTLGGDLEVVGDTTLTNVAVSGDETVAGDTITAGRVVSGTAMGLVTPTLGTLSFDYTEVLVPLNTTGATTAIDFGVNGLPVGVLGLGAAIRVVNPITGVNSTTGTLNINPTTSPAPAAVITSFTAGVVTAGLAPVLVIVSDANVATFVLSGGVDNTPSGGSIRVTVYFWRATPSVS